MTGSARLASLAQPEGPGIAVPLGLRPAARIQERDWLEFLTNATQLANGCRDLAQAVGLDVVVVTSVNALLEHASRFGLLAAGPHYLAAVDATRRLVETLGARAAVAVSLPGPVALSSVLRIAPSAAVDQVLDAAKAYLASGVDLVLIEEPTPDRSLSLGTLVNIATFHQAHVVTIGPEWSGLASATVAELDHVGPSSGIVVTAGELPRDLDLGELEDWIAAISD